MVRFYPTYKWGKYRAYLRVEPDKTCNLWIGKRIIVMERWGVPCRCPDAVQRVGLAAHIQCQVSLFYHVWATWCGQWLYSLRPGFLSYQSMRKMPFLQDSLGTGQDDNSSVPSLGGEGLEVYCEVPLGVWGVIHTAGGASVRNLAVTNIRLGCGYNQSRVETLKMGEDIEIMNNVLFYGKDNLEIKLHQYLTLIVNLH